MLPLPRAGTVLPSLSVRSVTDPPLTHVNDGGLDRATASHRVVSVRRMTDLADLAALDATAQADLVHQKELTPRELVAAAIERIERVNPELNAVIHERFDKALADADRVDVDAPFAGVPYLAK